MQWSDPESPAILEGLLTEPQVDALLVVGTMAPSRTELAWLAPMRERLGAAGVLVSEIALGPLSVDACTELLCEVLGCDPDDGASLAPVVSRKTGNNPLLIRAFLELMQDRGAVTHKIGVGWTWSLSALEAVDTPDEAVPIVVQRVSGVDDAQRELLAVASCIGDSFDVDSLARVTDLSVDALESAATGLCDAGLLAACRSGLRFVHASVREAAQALLGADARERVHYRLGTELLARTTQDALPERAMTIVEHLNRATALLTEPERIQLIELDLVAARRALAVGGASGAESHLAAARAVLGDSDWDVHPALCFELWLESARSALYAGRLDDTFAWLDALEPHADTIERWSQVAALQIATSANLGDLPETARLTLACLRRLGVRVPRRPSRMRVLAAVLWTDWVLRDVEPGDTPRTAPQPPELVAARARVQSAGFAAVAAVDRRVGILFSASRVRRTKRVGHTGRPGGELIAYCAHLHAFFPSRRALDRYATVGLQWAERYDTPSEQLRGRFVAHALIQPWLLPRLQAAEPLRALAHQSLELGLLEYSIYSRSFHALIRALSGVTVPTAIRELLEDMPRPDPAPHFMRLLCEGGDDAAAVRSTAEALRSVPFSEAARTYSIASLVLHILGHHQLVLEVLDRVAPDVVEGISGFVVTTDSALFRGMSAAALAEAARGGERRTLIRIVRREHGRMRRWARGGPDYEHMELLLAAARAAAGGRLRRAVALLSRAAQRADRQGYPHHAGLAHERRAALLERMRRTTEASDALRNAERRFAAWEAPAKVRQIRDDAARRGLALRGS